MLLLTIPLPLTITYSLTNVLPLTSTWYLVQYVTAHARFATFTVAAVAEERFQLVERRLIQRYRILPLTDILPLTNMLLLTSMLPLTNIVYDR